MKLDPRDRPGAGADVGGWTKELRIVVAALSVAVIWIVTSTALGPSLGAATALLAAVLVPGYLFRMHLTPAHLPLLCAFGAPVLIGGLWLS
jgi:Flp pilus assembly protein TadB